jgi:hypothetical protein
MWKFSPKAVADQAPEQFEKQASNFLRDSRTPFSPSKKKELPISISTSSKEATLVNGIQRLVGEGRRRLHRIHCVLPRPRRSYRRWLDGPHSEEHHALCWRTQHRFSEMFVAFLFSRIACYQEAIAGHSSAPVKSA